MFARRQTQTPNPRAHASAAPRAHASGAPAPRLWRGDSRPLADASASLARWIGQVDRDSGGWALPRLVQETDYSFLFWDMWTRGLRMRTAVGYRLNRKYGRGVAPDPLRPLAFSYQATIAEAARMCGMDLLVATAENGLAVAAEALAGQAGRQLPLWAWLETYPDRRPPCLIVVPDAPELLYWRAAERLEAPVPQWSLQAANCIGKYDRDRELYTGMAAPGDRVLPPDWVREPSWAPILHIFTKALLGLPRECPPRLGCQCNAVLAILDQPPPAHPQATGTLGRTPAYGRPAGPSRPLGG